MPSQPTIASVRSLLEELRAILARQGESNWIRGVQAAIDSLDNPDDQKGYSDAQSIYRTMTMGRGPFSEYYTHRDDFEQRVSANERLDQIRSQLWQLFDR
jgi:hypothetical protein